MAYFHFTSESGKRERWTVKVNAETLKQCCKERRRYHEDRCNFWGEQHKIAEEKLRSCGIKLESLPITGGQRMEAKLDSSLANRLGECENKIKHHKDCVARFVAYQAFLSQLGPQAEVDLNVDDVLYFNLGGADKEGESL